MLGEKAITSFISLENMTENARNPDLPKKFNLCKQFALLSFICISVMAIALGLTVSHFLTKDMVKREWETTAQFVRTETRQLILPENFKVQDYRTVSKRFEKLHRQITMMPGIARIKVYNPQGAIIWSDEKRLIGSTFPKNPELAEALGGQVVANLSLIRKGENVYERGPFQSLVEVYVPIFSSSNVDSQVIGVIETYRQAGTLFKDVQRARIVILLISLLGGLLLYISLFTVIRRASKKIDEQQGNLLAMQSELNASQRMAAVGEMAAAVAHGIGNPISSIRAAAQLAKLEFEETDGYDHSQSNQRNLLNIIQEVDRVEKRIRGLLNFARPLEPHPSPVEINLLLQDTVRVLNPRFDEAKITPRLQLTPALDQTVVDPIQIEQAFFGLLVNAIEATPSGGTVSITTDLVPFGSASQGLRISIEDTGEGIHPENLKRVFEPFFTTKPNGTGIGLPLAKKFVEKNRGSISLSKGSNGGTRVEVVFPITDTKSSVKDVEQPIAR